MQDIWTRAPFSAIYVAVNDGQITTTLNACATRWAAQVGAVAADWQALARSISACDSKPRILMLHGQAVRCTPVPMDSGCLIWLEPMNGAASHAKADAPSTPPVGTKPANTAAEESLQRERERVAQSHQDWVGFMARVSHELRTPLNAVLGFARLIEDDRSEPPTARQRERLNSIANGGTRLLTLVDDLLELGQLESQPAGPELAPAASLISAAQALQEAVQSRAEQVREWGVQIEVDLGPLGLQVRAEHRRLVRALSLMLEHTLRRSAAGTTVQVRAQALGSGASAWARFVLQDGGAGLTPEQQLWVFEPFAPYQGSGVDEDASPLQLSLARRLVLSMGGRVWASDGAGTPGQGVEISMEFPCALEAEALPLAPATRLEILCVEDNAVNLQLVRELVALRPGVVLRTAVDATSALAAAHERAPDVFLLDMHLPDLHGLELMQRLRSQEALARCAYVALSADVLPQNVERALRSGFDEYWTKPIDFTAFLRGLDRLVAQRR